MVPTRYLPQTNDMSADLILPCTCTNTRNRELTALLSPASLKRRQGYLVHVYLIFLTYMLLRTGTYAYLHSTHLHAVQLDHE